MDASYKYILPCTAADIVTDYPRKTVILKGPTKGLCQDAGEVTDSEQGDNSLLSRRNTRTLVVFKLYHTAS